MACLHGKTLGVLIILAPTVRLLIIPLCRKGIYQYGEEVFYRCDNGYVLTGPEKRQCTTYNGGSEGLWSGFTPLCLRKFRFGVMLHFSQPLVFLSGPSLINEVNYFILSN